MSIRLLLLYLGGASSRNGGGGFEFNSLRVAIFEPYPVISYLVLVVWLGIAVMWLIDFAEAWVPWLRQTFPGKLAAGHFERSISLNPKAGNTALCPLYQTYRLLNVEATAGDLLERVDGKMCD